MTIFQPNIASDWDQLIAESPLRPEPAASDLDEQSIERFQAYNLGLAPIATPDVRQVWKAVRRVEMFNEHRPLGGRRLLIIDGPSHVGKTTAILTEAIQQTRQARQAEPGRRPNPITWIYVEATPEGRGRALAQALCRFCGIPFGRSDSAAALVAQLAHIAQRMGLRGVIIDDIHFLRAGRPEDANSLANVLKHLITAVPATFVLIGINMATTALVSRTKTGNSPADQIANRADWVMLRPWPKEVDGAANTAWPRLVTSLADGLAFPKGTGQCRLTSRATLDYLIDGSQQRPGTAAEWVTLAANHAIENGRPLDRNALRATHPQLRSRP